jgi:hypothetical protein
MLAAAQQGAAMGDLSDTGARRPPQGQHWLTREAELVGVGLWAVGITTLAVLPDTGIFLLVHPPLFVGLQVVTAWLWLLVGAQGWRRWTKRHTQAPAARDTREPGR